jgi:pimeloyl-ACP methyl ester carboxylesterase
MAIARNGDIELHYETFGSDGDPVLLLVNGLGSQCINFDPEWCEQFAATGHRVIRFDNRDVGLSTKLDAPEFDGEYDLRAMAADAVAVLDAVSAERAHVLGVSLGGMVVQRMAIHHADRLRTMTSVMSRTGEPGFGDSAPEAMAFLTAPPATSRDEYVERQVAAVGVYGSRPDWVDLDDVRRRAAAAFDRCFHPAGVGRQFMAVGRDGSRSAELATIEVPTLVLHGSRDTLIQPSGGRQTAEVIPNARYVEIEGMGHDYPRPVWSTWVDTWSSFVAQLA